MRMRPRKSVPIQKSKIRTMNHNKMCGGKKVVPKFKNLRTVKGIRKGIGLVNRFRKEF